MAIQLPLLFEFQSNQNFASFFVGNNAEIVSHLQNFLLTSGEQQIFLWGDRGLGKTHLLQACCQLAREQGIYPFYFDCQYIQATSPELLLDGLEYVELVCFDNLECIAGHTEWELALFHFYNQHKAQQHRLLLSSIMSPQNLSIQLPDLKTRLAWGLALKMQPLNDEQLIEAIACKAHDMGFEISTPVGQFLLSHYRHNLASVWSLLEKLDRATLAARRKVTIPFLKQMIEQSAGLTDAEGWSGQAHINKN
jgi:DnaA family protein